MASDRRGPPAVLEGVGPGQAAAAGRQAAGGRQARERAEEAEAADGTAGDLLREPHALSGGALGEVLQRQPARRVGCGEQRLSGRGEEAWRGSAKPRQRRARIGNSGAQKRPL